MPRRQVWRRLGHVFNATGKAPWIATHATYPTPLVLDDGRVRVFFSPRDLDNRSSITSLDLVLDDARFDIVSGPTIQLLSPGPRGAFDDSGVSVSCVLPDGDRLLVYYLGWSTSVTVPFGNFIGLAIGDREGTKLERLSPAPVLDRTAIDPFTLGYPWVVRADADWRMWYGSHLHWGPRGLEMEHVIKEARSRDGQRWTPTGHVAIPLAGGTEYAVSRPCVLRDPDCYRMWYSRRTPAYGLGYAESTDGARWRRADDTLELSGPCGEWEDETAEYPAVFDYKGLRYMLYNGNGYGRSGFGLAVLET